MSILPPELLQAAKHGHVGVLRVIQAHGCSLDTTSARFRFATALLLSAQNDQVEMVKYLLESGAALELADDNNCTPLYVASQNGNVEVVKMLLEFGAKVNVTSNMFAPTPLLKAASRLVNQTKKQDEVVRILLEHGACVAEEHPFTPLPPSVRKQRGDLAAATIAGHDAEVASILDAVPGESGELILPPCNEDCVTALVDMGFAEVRARKALLSGCSGAEDSIEWILAHGGDAGIDDPIPLVALPDARQSPEFMSFLLNLASQQKQSSVINVLRQRGAQILTSFTNPDPLQPCHMPSPPMALDNLHAAVEAGVVASVREHLEAGADPNQMNQNGDPHLFTAVRNGDVAVVSLFLKFDANVNATTSGGLSLSPLIMAATNGSFQIAQMLIESGADVNYAVRLDGRTALAMAEWRHNEPMISLLVRNGAQPTTKAFDPTPPPGYGLSCGMAPMFN